MRASKLRLPESTATTDRFSFVTAASISGLASGPELPMHVVQPYPTRKKPSCSSGSSRFAFLGQSRDRLGLRPRSRGEDGGKAAPHVRQRDAVLRPLRSGHARLHLAKVELEQLGELRRRRAVDPEEALLLRIALDQLDLLAVATGHLQVAQRLLVHREKRRGRPVLGAHVAE